jgi:sodium-dependent dicarboxylate transporter 2/3/5
VWWVLEPIPLAATSLVPFGLLPLGGVLSHREVATAYGHHLVLLMLAGSMVSTAMERSDAHRRVAVGLVRAVGGHGGRRLVLGFLLASTALSMWMSNTATTVMLLPVAIAVLSTTGDDRLTVPLLLAVAYGASIGGSGTPIGTPPNLIFLDRYRDITGTEMSFTAWMGYGVPVVLVMVPAAWLWLARGIGPTGRVELPELGRWRPEERRVLTVFGLMALAWITRAGPSGGWAGWLGVGEHAGDSTVAIVAALALFVLPRGNGTDDRLLDWETARKIPWGVFIMIGGGMAIGKAFGASELDAELGRALGFLTTWPVWVVVPLVCLVATSATEVTSNTAMANVLMPILGAAAGVGELDPRWLMLPAALGLNHAFMLPVATAPNAIVYGTGMISTARMAREGFALNLVGMVVIAAACGLLLR